MKLLLADDEKIERDSLRLMLIDKYPGLFEELFEASNGEDALHLALAHKPDIILMDVQMPVMDGLEAARQMREQGIQADIIIITAYPLFEYAQKAIHCKVTDYLLKPYSMKALCDTLDKLLPPGHVSKLAPTQHKAAAEQKPNELIVLVKEYIQKNYADSITLDDIAQYVGKSKFYISRLFNQYESESLSEYINRVRIANAAQMIAQGLSVCEIAYRLGFKEPTYFSKVFKRYMHVTPSQYAEQERQQ